MGHSRLGGGAQQVRGGAQQVRGRGSGGWGGTQQVRGRDTEDKGTENLGACGAVGTCVVGQQSSLRGGGGTQ